MTKTLEIGDVLEIGDGAARLVYVGDEKADVERFIPERSRTGGLTNSGRGKWLLYQSAETLNEKQIAAWIAKKG
jgi:hypothetical protein